MDSPYGRLANAVAWLEYMAGTCQMNQVRPYLDRIKRNPAATQEVLVEVIRLASGGGGEPIDADFAYQMLTNALDNALHDVTLQRERLEGIIRVMNQVVDVPSSRTRLQLVSGQADARLDQILDTVGQDVSPELLTRLAGARRRVREVVATRGQF